MSRVLSTKAVLFRTTKISIQTHQYDTHFLHRRISSLSRVLMSCIITLLLVLVFLLLVASNPGQQEANVMKEDPVFSSRVVQ